MTEQPQVDMDAPIRTDDPSLKLLCRSRNEILKLRYIPPRVLQQAGLKLPWITEAERRAIRQRLNMRHDAPFRRCRGQSQKKVMDLAAKGDHRHMWKSRDGHPPECGFCEQCRCERLAGSGTKGDFYGLGPQTGHLGVGYCTQCEQHHNIDPSFIITTADTEMKHIQELGDADVDSELAIRHREVVMAETRATQKLRDEVVLLNQRLVDMRNKNPVEITEYVQGQLVQASYLTRAKLDIELAKAISSTAQGAFKMDDSKYIALPYVEFLVSEVWQSIENNVRLMDEMEVARHIHGSTPACGDGPITDFVLYAIKKEIKAAVLRTKAKAGRK